MMQRIANNNPVKIKRIIRKPTYLIIGLTQQGKSSICQSLYPDQKIKVGLNNSGKSVTTETKVFNIQRKRNSYIDTVGFQDSKNPQQSIKQRIAKIFKDCKNNNIRSLDGIIIAVSFKQAGSLEYIKEIIENLNDLNQNTPYPLIICLTKGNLTPYAERVKVLENLTYELVNTYDIDRNRIIQFKTNYICRGKLRIFKNENINFERKLRNLPKSTIEIRNQGNFYELNVKPKHPGGRPQLLQSKDFISENEFFILSELYSISTLKIYQSNKCYQKTKQDDLQDEKKTILQRQLETTNILFRKKYNEEEEDLFPYKNCLIGRFAGMLTDNFRKEIIEFIRDEEMFNLSESSILKCLYLQHQLKENAFNDNFESFSKNQEVLDLAEYYYQWITQEYYSSEQYESSQEFDQTPEHFNMNIKQSQFKNQEQESSFYQTPEHFNKKIKQSQFQAKN